MIFALMGRRSQIWMPGTLVGMDPKAPRYSTGASGFGSQVSCWLGPPRIQRMMTDLSREVGLPAARAACSDFNRPASVSPAYPSAPARRKPRRLMARLWRNSGQPSSFGREEDMGRLLSGADNVFGRTNAPLARACHQDNRLSLKS